MRRILAIVLLVLLVAGGVTVGYVYYTGRQSPPQYLTARVERGQIATTVSATGTLNAVVTVQVGSQVTGSIAQLFADYNSPVEEGQVIAQIDPASFAARVSQAQANLASAKANVHVAQATMDNTQAAVETSQANLKSEQANVEKARVAVADAERTLARRRGLVSRALASQSDLDAAQTAYDSAVSQLNGATAQYEAAQGQLKSGAAQMRLAAAQHAVAQAQVEQAQAALQAADLDLAHTTIHSPVQGIVISRSVDVGQTVSASLQAPTLFLIAQDLTRMQVNTNVSEADIGKVREGQAVTFTVDAYPDQTFMGQVVQVRNAPITVQNVVTYDAVVEVSNPQLQLRPGMTANVSFIVAQRDDTLKVPNAALRFQPEGGNRAAGASAGGESGGGDRTQAIRQRLTSALALTNEQQSQLDNILQKARQQGMRLREQNVSEDDLRKSRRELQTQTRSSIRGILNDVQRQQYAELVKTLDQQRQESSGQERAGRVWIRQADGTLQPLALRLGIADDTFTEIVAGDVHEGQEVVTGRLSVAQRPGATPPGFGRRAF